MAHRSSASQEYQKVSPKSLDIISSNKDLSGMRDSLLSKYGNTPYASLIQNNPYAFVPHLPYGASEDFYNDLYSEYQRSASEYYAQIQQLMLEQEYNSEPEKVKRLRQAGINPDLQGLQNASEASPFDMPMTSPDLPSSVDSSATARSTQLNMANTILGSIQSVLQTGMQFAQGIEQYRGRQYENFNLALSNKGNLWDQTLKYLAGMMPVDKQQEFVSDFSDFGDMLIQAAGKVADDPTIPKRIRKAWSRQIQQFNPNDPDNWPISLMSAYENYRKQYAENRNSAFNIFGNGVFSSNDEEMLSNVFSLIGDPFRIIQGLKNDYNIKYLQNEIEYQNKLDELGTASNKAVAEDAAYQTSILQSNFTSSYLHRANELGLPGSTAEAELEESYARKQKALYDQTMLKILEQQKFLEQSISEALSKKAKDGSFLASLLLTCLPSIMQSITGFANTIIPNPERSLDFGAKVLGHMLK